jgi:hypothetical protein
MTDITNQSSVKKIKYVVRSIRRYWYHQGVARQKSQVRSAVNQDVTDITKVSPVENVVRSINSDCICRCMVNYAIEGTMTSDLRMQTTEIFIILIN